MRLPPRGAGVMALVAMLTACSDQAMLSPSPEVPRAQFDAHAEQPAVRISEIHYDNTGTDSGESVEISGPAGTDLSGWTLVHYNGANGAVISTRSLPTPIPATCGARGVVVVEYPVNGLQNDNEGLALVDAGGAVVEFLAYEGNVVPAAGPAVGLTPVVIGVSEPGTTPVGHSLQRDGAGTWQGPVANTFGACNDDGGGEPPPPPPPPADKAPASAVVDTWFSELHYDNDGADSGEAIELEGPAGRSVEGWRVVLYNQGVAYGTRTLSGVIPATCGERGVIVLSYPANGIQNGGQDGLALIDADGGVVQLLSYEGSFTATDGAALHWDAVDIGVAEASNAPVGSSLQRIGGTWQPSRPHTFGACNDAPTTPPPPVLPLVINELMAEPIAAENSSWGEWFEVYNHGAEPIDLQGWTIASGGASQPDHVIASSVVVPAGGYAVLGRGWDPARNGGVTIDYNYFVGPTSTIWLDNNDWLVLRNAAGVTIDSVAWNGVAAGTTRALRSAALENANVDGSAWGYSTTTFGAGDYGTPGAANGELSDAAPAVQRVVISGRSSLPVGFQDVLFASLRDATGATIPTTWTWTVETPSLARIEGERVVTALAPGQAVLRATAADGTFGRYTLTTYEAAPSASASYAGNAEFGEPQDADPADDFIIRRPQYTLSYSGTRNTPNWVAYNLEASHFGSEDRCNCFSADPALPANFARILTTDYTGAGDYAGYGIDRGHMVRSFDRGAGALDNALTFYLTNIVPQTADQNQGPWAALETALGNRAQGGAEEIYIITGVAGNAGTVKGEGKIVIPESVWKVALILPRDRGLAHLQSWRDVEVIAVLMPNVPGIRDVPWQTYLTTVDAIEAASGYDLLALLPDAIERVVESGTRPPVAVLDAPASGLEGVALSLSAARSSDPDGEALAWDWDFGDGSSSVAQAPTHTWAQDGSYSVRLIVTDIYGLADTATATISVANVVPTVHFGGATLLPGETYAAAGSFEDSGADAWSAHVDYGAGGGLLPLALAGRTFALSHTYAAAGRYTVTVQVRDDDATGTGSAEVVVLSHAAVFEQLLEQVAALNGAGALADGNATSLRSKLMNAARQAERGQENAAANVVNAFVHEVQALARAGRLPAAAAESLTALALRLETSLGR